METFFKVIIITENTVEQAMNCKATRILTLVHSKMESNKVMAHIIFSKTHKYTLANGMEVYLMEQVFTLEKIVMKAIF